MPLRSSAAKTLGRSRAPHSQRTSDPPIISSTNTTSLLYLSMSNYMFAEHGADGPHAQSWLENVEYSLNQHQDCGSCILSRSLASFAVRYLLASNVRPSPSTGIVHSLVASFIRTHRPRYLTRRWPSRDELAIAITTAELLAKVLQRTL